MKARDMRGVVTTRQANRNYRTDTCVFCEAGPACFYVTIHLRAIDRPLCLACALSIASQVKTFEAF